MRNSLAICNEKVSFCKSRFFRGHMPVKFLLTKLPYGIAYLFIGLLHP